MSFVDVRWCQVFCVDDTVFSKEAYVWGDVGVGVIYVDKKEWSKDKSLWGSKGQWYWTGCPAIQYNLSNHIWLTIMCSITLEVYRSVKPACSWNVDVGNLLVDWSNVGGLPFATPAMHGLHVIVRATCYPGMQILPDTKPVEYTFCGQLTSRRASRHISRGHFLAKSYEFYNMA